MAYIKTNLLQSEKNIYFFVRVISFWNQTIHIFRSCMLAFTLYYINLTRNAEIMLHPISSENLVESAEGIRSSLMSSFYI